MNGKTQLVGLMGWPVSHSFSPVMHNAALAAAGLNWAYVPLPVQSEDVKTAVFGLRALGFKGCNVTVPHKQAVMPYLDAIDPAAQAIGAVNTIVVEEEKDEERREKSEERGAKLVGYNTDWLGFLRDVAMQGVNVASQTCLVLGAGGSARAVVYALQQAGAQVHLLARRPEQAYQLIQDLAAANSVIVAERPFSHPYTLIVNTTPLGMTPHTETSPWPDDTPIPTTAFVYDLVYNPRQTKLIRQAQAAGCRTANGLGMLLQQGALAFRLWTGVEPDVRMMREKLE